MFKELLKFLGESIRTERYVSRPGLLQAIDPRVKLVALSGFIVVAIMSQSVSQMAVMLLVITALAIASRLPLHEFFARATLVPAFSAVIVLPLPFITPGFPLFIFQVGPWTIALTFEGLYRAVQFTVRIWVCVGALTLLTLTTKFTDMLHGMERLRFPRLFS